MSCLIGVIIVPLNRLLPTHHHQQSDGSNAEECVGRRFWDCVKLKVS